MYVKVFGSSVVPAVVSFVVGLGLGKMFGQKHGYQVKQVLQRSVGAQPVTCHIGQTYIGLREGRRRN